ncbi:c-type cytochrome [Pelagibacterium sp.]|uniref:c-type cytochrome n=1 Tax=Pelagibacterium sp. TaxID=1967288 RepID=UPI003BA8C785
MKRTYIYALAFAGAATGCAAAFAHNGATGIVAERMMGMMMLGEQMQVLTPIISGETDPTPAVVEEAAAMIAAHSGSAMTQLFPEGSTEFPSEARPEIWEDFTLFSQYAQELQRLAQELAGTTDLPDPGAPARAALNNWASMNTSVLLGLAPKTSSISSPPESETPPIRSAAAVASDIANTCSACHTVFRK